MKDKFIPKTTSTDFSKISLKIINPKIANKIVEENHYSGTSVKGVVYHIGIFYENTLKGVAQYGYGINPAKTSQWVEGTKREEFLELNRLWLDDSLGFNSESYVISQSLKFIKKLNPKLKWIISFADGMMGKMELSINQQILYILDLEKMVGFGTQKMEIECIVFLFGINIKLYNEMY